jgi:hypothetical protein
LLEQVRDAGIAEANEGFGIGVAVEAGAGFEASAGSGREGANGEHPVGGGVAGRGHRDYKDFF